MGVTRQVKSGELGSNASIVVGQLAQPDYKLVNSGGTLHFKCTNPSPLFPCVPDVSNSASRLVIGQDGNVGIGTTSPGAKLDVAGGDINMDGGRTIYSRGRMHLFGEELLYLLNRSGVIVSKAWDANGGNLTVEGDGIFNGNVGVGTTSPGAKLDVAGGDINMDGGRTIYSRGRMHVFGEEILYLLNRSGVHISNAWGGNGNLTVDGNVEISGKLEPFYDSEWRAVDSFSDHTETFDFTPFTGNPIDTPGRIELLQCGALDAAGRCTTEVVYASPNGMWNGSWSINPISMTIGPDAFNNASRTIYVRINGPNWVWGFWDSNVSDWRCTGDADGNCRTGYYRVKVWR